MKNDFIDNWDNSAQRFDDFKKDDLAWNYILFPALKKFLTFSKNKITLDAGCGNGVFTALLSEKSKSTLGIDLSNKMIQIAKKKNNEIYNLDFKVADLRKMEDLKTNSFDTVFCINVLVDTPYLSDSVKSLSRVTKKGGKIIIAIEHPFYTSKSARANLEKIRNSYQDRNYFNEFKFTSYFLGENFPIIGIHRPLEKYLSFFIKNNLSIINYSEPKPIKKIEKLKLFDEEPLFAVFLLEKQ